MTFRVPFLRKLIASAFLIPCAVLIGAMALHLVIRLFSNPAGFSFREGFFMLLPSIALFASVVLSLLAMWGTRLHLSDQGITYRPGGLLESRFVPWEDVVTVKWEKRRVSRILLCDGRYISFGGLEDPEELARMVREELTEVNVPARWSYQEKDFSETFKLSRAVRNIQVAFYVSYALAILWFLVRGPLWRFGEWPPEPFWVLLLFAVVALLSAVNALRTYRRVRIEISSGGVRSFDVATGRDRSSVILHFRRRIPWSKIVQVVRYMGGRGGLLLTNGQFLPITGLDREEIFLHLVECRLELLQNEGRRAELKRLKKSAVTVFIIAVVVLWGMLAIAVISSVT